MAYYFSLLLLPYLGGNFEWQLLLLFINEITLKLTILHVLFFCFVC